MSRKRAAAPAWSLELSPKCRWLHRLFPGLALLTSDKPTDENSLANPSRVAQVTLGIDVGESAIRPHVPRQLGDGDPGEGGIGRVPTAIDHIVVRAYSGQVESVRASCNPLPRSPEGVLCQVTTG